jgi:hypothetical protein
MALMSCKSHRATRSESHAQPAPQVQPSTVRAQHAIDASIRVERTRPNDASAAKVIDKPDWPVSMKRLTATWVIYPAVMRPVRSDVSVPSRLVEIVLRSGAVARRYAVQEYSTITYATDMQSRCTGGRLPKTRVAELFMNGTGNLWLALERRGDALELIEQSSSDGLCEDGPCRIESETLAHFPVPASVSVDERFHVVEGRGIEHDEFCANQDHATDPRPADVQGAARVGG